MTTLADSEVPEPPGATAGRDALSNQTDSVPSSLRSTNVYVGKCAAHLRISVILFFIRKCTPATLGYLRLRS